MTAETHGVEIEIKLKVTDSVLFRNKIALLSFECQRQRTHEYNILFDTEAERLKNDRMILRLRRWGEECILTVKAPLPKEDLCEGYKMRRELEVQIDDFERTRAILDLLGFSPIFIYEKYRSEYRSPENLKLTLDETPIGCYAELEGPIPLIDLYVEKLGYSKADAVCQSYRSLFLLTGQTGDMLFD